MRHLAVFILSASFLLPFAGALGSELVEAGDTFPAFEARDQHDVDYRFDPGTATVLIAFDMATAKLSNAVLAEQGAGFLDGHRVVYIANIYGMPRIGRLFAFPKMRKYPHRIILADAKNLLSPFPQKEDHVTVIQLNDSAVIQATLFWNPKRDPLEDFLR